MKAVKETRTQLKIHRAAYISSLVLSKTPTLGNKEIKWICMMYKRNTLGGQRYQPPFAWVSSQALTIG